MSRFFLPLVRILFLGILSSAFLAMPAHGQSTVTVIGPVTPGDCVIFNSTTVLKDSGSTQCNGGAGGTPGGTNGQVQFNNAGIFGGFTPNGDAVINTATGVVIVTKTNGVPFGTFATANAATPPAIGGTTPAAGSFSSLTDTGISGSTQCVQANASGVLSGSGVPCVPSSNYFVATTGSDSNNCLTSGTACLTLQHVANIIASTGSFASTAINVAAGSYSVGVTMIGGQVSIIGAGSATTVIADNGTNCSGLIAKNFAIVTISGVTITSTSCGADIWAQYGSQVNVGTDIVLGSSAIAGLYAQDNSKIYTNANFTVTGIIPNLFLIAQAAIRMFGGPPVVTFFGSPIITTLVDCVDNGQMRTGAAQFNGGASVTNRYAMSQNCSLDQEQNVTELPGAIEGGLSGGAVFYNAGPTFTGQMSGTTTLTVTGMSAGLGALGVGNQILGAGVPANTKITAFGTGTGLNGTYTLNNTATVGPESMTGSSIYPCIDSVGLCPVVNAAPAGLGAGGTATVTNDQFGGDYAGLVSLSTGSSGTAASGSVGIVPHSHMTNCSGSLGGLGGSSWPQGSTLQVLYIVFSNVSVVFLNWQSPTALAISSPYKISYACR